MTKTNQFSDNLSHVSTPFIVGIAGGSGSGKSTLAQSILDTIPKQNVLHIAHDYYYKDQSHLSMDERNATNYDHPDSLETELLIKHLSQLKMGQPVMVPRYDFVQRNRELEYISTHPKPIIIVEGILLFHDASLRTLFSLKVFVDAQSDVRLARRLLRDQRERNIPFELGLEFYLNQVKPMHEQYVEPYKEYADLIIPEGGRNGGELLRILENVM